MGISKNSAGPSRPSLMKQHDLPIRSFSQGRHGRRRRGDVLFLRPWSNPQTPDGRSSRVRRERGPRSASQWATDGRPSSCRTDAELTAFGQKRARSGRSPRGLVGRGIHHLLSITLLLLRSTHGSLAFRDERVQVQSCPWLLQQNLKSCRGS